MRNYLTINSLYNRRNKINELYHFGIIGMHWGIRRFQPYGQGYDADHKGKEVGLAARLSGRGNSYSSLYGKGSRRSTIDIVRGVGKKASRGVNEALERMNYANDRMGQALKNVGRKSKNTLAGYVAGKYDPDAKRIYEQASASELAKGVLSTFGNKTKTKVSDIKHMSYDDILSRLGNGASNFQSAMNQTKVAGKDFARNSKLVVSMLAGAADPRSSASQILEGRYGRSVNPKVTLAYKPGHSGGLEDLGAGRTLSKMSDASRREILRSVSGLKTPSSDKLYKLGERKNVGTGETVNLYGFGFKDKRNDATDGRARSVRGWDSDKTYELSKGVQRGDLDLARSTLLSDLDSKSKTEWSRVLDGKDALEALTEGMKSYDKMKSDSIAKIMYQDPYMYEIGKNLLGL